MASSKSKAKATQLWNEGMVLFLRYEYPASLKRLQQAKDIFRQEGYKTEEASTLYMIARNYYKLGDKQLALAYYMQALTLWKTLKDKRWEVRVLNHIGWVYESLGKQKQALTIYKQVLPLLKDLDDLPGKATTLTVIGRVYEDLGDKQQALAYYMQSLTLTNTLKNRSWEATNLNDIGRNYSALGKQKLALEYFKQALPLWKGENDAIGKAKNIRNIAFTLSKQNQPTLAIAFYKQSINIVEPMRNFYSGLPNEPEQPYLKPLHKMTKEADQEIQNRVISIYQELAKLLLEQGRIMEALQVLDLLKVQELQDFFKDVKGNERTAQGIELLPQEQQILSKLNTSIIPDLNTYLNSPEVNGLAQQLQTTAAAQSLTLNAYTDLQTRLKTLGTNSALLYPLITQDSLELVLFTPNAPPVHKTVKVSKTELDQAISDFSLTLQKKYSGTVQAKAQNFYKWLLQPLEDDLKAANIQTIIYAPDGRLRYIPLAALHNGQQWVIEKYQINHVTAFALTSLKPQTAQPPRILAAAYTEPQASTVNQIQFLPIPAALSEAKYLSQQFPQTTLLLDKAFNREAMSPNRLVNYSIIHLATHGYFATGTPEQSFIVLNNKESITLRDLKAWKLPNVDLVVLSACQTALGTNLSNGIEVLGFGHQLQVAQARAAISSLWNVDDEQTNHLMNLFYEQLKQGKPSTEALALAQRAMIQQSDNNTPYYWAPFILIGNGL